MSHQHPLPGDHQLCWALERQEINCQDREIQRVEKPQQHFAIPHRLSVDCNHSALVQYHCPAANIQGHISGKATENLEEILFSLFHTLKLLVSTMASQTGKQMEFRKGSRLQDSIGLLAQDGACECLNLSFPAQPLGDTRRKLCRQQ